MDKLLQKATGILLGTALAAMVSTVALADDSDATLPGDPEMAIIEYADETDGAS